MRMGSTMRKSEQPAESPPDDRLRVVIADDASAMRALLRRMLEDTAAFEIVGEASDGAEAVEMTGALHPDLVVLDLSMPVMDGLSAIPAIRRISPLTRIVVLSALEPERVREQAMASGADAFIEKCLVADSLAQRLVEACWLPVGDESVVLPPDSPSADPASGSDQHPAAAGAFGAGEPGMEWFRLAFDHAPIGMALLDLQGRLEQVNDAFCRIVARVAGRGRRHRRRCHQPSGRRRPPRRAPAPDAGRRPQPGPGRAPLHPGRRPHRLGGDDDVAAAERQTGRRRASSARRSTSPTASRPR